ncbi:MAG: glycerol-3-phosphate acyltransferase, partial [Albidovulum sp.]|nr:glycerol-3-phosphate acyltransferase [Albidovulum sp.]
MTGSITLPFWVFAVVSALAFWVVLDRILMPGARWFMHRRLNRMIEEVNVRLELQIPAFQQTRRRVLI